MNINWHKLAEIKELKPFFEQDFKQFQSQIETELPKFQSLENNNLDEIALIRALEVTNGCTQWVYRLEKEDRLSLEKTRECMNLSMSTIKYQRLILKTGEVLEFSPTVKNIMREIRDIYIDGFKNNIPEKEQEFHASSTAQFLSFGQPRMNQSFAIIKENYIDIFTEYFINKGIDYVQRYLNCIVS